MLKSLALVVVVVMVGGAAAADSISEQDQIYVLSGVLGSICLLLTIAAILSTLAIVKLQKQVAVLQVGAKTVLDQPRPAPPPRPYRGPPARDNYY